MFIGVSSLFMMLCMRLFDISFNKPSFNKTFLLRDSFNVLFGLVEKGSLAEAYYNPLKPAETHWNPLKLFSRVEDERGKKSPAFTGCMLGASLLNGG